MTTALFLLRCKEAGLTLEELDRMSAGLVFDMFTERANDSAHYDYIATQADFDRFAGR